MTELTCIVCPRGCRLHVDEANGYKVTGNSCEKGAEYGANELRNPTRVLTSTVIILGAAHSRLPVKTNGAIPKGMIFDAMKLLNGVVMTSPVALGQVIIKDILGTGIDFVASRAL